MEIAQIFALPCFQPVLGVVSPSYKGQDRPFDPCRGSLRWTCWSCPKQLSEGTCAPFPHFSASDTLPVPHGGDLVYNLERKPPDPFLLLFVLLMELHWFGLEVLPRAREAAKPGGGI